MYKLFSDSEVWHKEYPINATLGEMTGIYNKRFKLLDRGDDASGSYKEYRLIGTTYTFTVRTVCA